MGQIKRFRLKYLVCAMVVWGGISTAQADGFCSEEGCGVDDILAPEKPVSKTNLRLLQMDYNLSAGVGSNEQLGHAAAEWLAVARAEVIRRRSSGSFDSRPDVVSSEFSASLEAGVGAVPYYEFEARFVGGLVGLVGGWALIKQSDWGQVQERAMQLGVPVFNMPVVINSEEFMLFRLAIVSEIGKFRDQVQGIDASYVLGNVILQAIVHFKDLRVNFEAEKFLATPGGSIKFNLEVPLDGRSELEDLDHGLAFSFGYRAFSTAEYKLGASKGKLSELLTLRAGYYFRF